MSSWADAPCCSRSDWGTACREPFGRASVRSQAHPSRCRTFEQAASELGSGDGHPPCRERWQPDLRTLLILRITSWKYRVRLPGFELPEALQPAEEKFDKSLAAALDGVADTMEGRQSRKTVDMTSAYAQLEQAASMASPGGQRQLTPQIQSFLLISGRIAALADCLTQEI